MLGRPPRRTSRARPQAMRSESTLRFQKSYTVSGEDLSHAEILWRGIIGYHAGTEASNHFVDNELEL